MLVNGREGRGVRKRDRLEMKIFITAEGDDCDIIEVYLMNIL